MPDSDFWIPDFTDSVFGKALIKLTIPVNKRTTKIYKRSSTYKMQILPDTQNPVWISITNSNTWDVPTTHVYADLLFSNGWLQRGCFFVQQKKRRETWCPGKGKSRLSMAPLSVAPLFPSFDKPGWQFIALIDDIMILNNLWKHWKNTLPLY